jgi:hypothetical protein
MELIRELELIGAEMEQRFQPAYQYKEFRGTVLL